MTLLNGQAVGWDLEARNMVEKQGWVWSADDNE